MSDQKAADEPEYVEPTPDGWIAIEHPETGGTGLVPDAPGVLAALSARGWVRATEDALAEEPAKKASKKPAADTESKE